ncbi:hypothetical protein DES53_103200 [Roseimicrobium gellanilyticum]|uniref:Uncharacterized protein n=1 Tax=Roseimicrobium gellanilyticum TaxID=748857 RepID=A0A366HRM5_9BACT|nr:hypothetical protein [Roseimicrobium gellanilyticum]RBP45202.1 hypothetical protein DES53_103200 [Roseimicrobium gellanilyticum]
MAVKLSANYSKKLGLPVFSSHFFSVSVEVELTDLSQVQAECAKLYQLLQQSVDKEIKQVGFVPDEFFGIDAIRQGQNSPQGRPHHQNQNGNCSHRNGNSQGQDKGSNGHSHSSNGNTDSWNCTDGQRGFILRIVNENQIDKQEVEDLSQQLYQLGVKQLNKMQASQLIEELLAKAGKPSGRSRWSQPRNQQQPS